MGVLRTLAGGLGIRIGASPCTVTRWIVLRPVPVDPLPTLRGCNMNWRRGNRGGSGCGRIGWRIVIWIDRIFFSGQTRGWSQSLVVVPRALGVWRIRLLTLGLGLPACLLGRKGGVGGGALP